MRFAEETRERCPVCGARFRETRLCSRCGADLSPLMYLAAKAHRLRERARERLVAGNAREAWELARAAESAAPTLAGKRLERLARWLGEEEGLKLSDLESVASPPS